MKKIIYQPIGLVHSPFKEPKGTPIQASGAKGIQGKIEVFQEFTEGLKDLEGFSHIILIYHLHLIKESRIEVKPFLDKNTHGIFATRAPGRPNSIGISVVRLVSIDKNILTVKDFDIIDGTPLLDIKPYISEFDYRQVTKNGWYKENVHNLSESKDDGRFV
ncbi:MAG: tRNA (N6-threonylcarbamoyladenosine(37)-N6)-methyltransferase TrmO [Flavobacteriaceae bacterium]|nr:tRNA (N6-threonylcarbamoyladenosine(37)-N6)-methyltransferase TrmO [Flavobacteriaceae bacterium]